MQILFNTIETLGAPLIAMGPIYAIATISIFISFLLSISYKLLVNQNKVKYIRTELKELKTKMNAAKKKGKEKELKTLFDKSLKLNNQQLMLNMKPLMTSMILISLFLPWLSHAYGDINTKLEDNKGIYEYKDITESFTIAQNTEATITFENPDIGTMKEGAEINIGERTHIIEIKKKDEKINKVIFKGFRANLPFTLPIFNKDTVGWLGLYIIISMPTTFLFRKILNVQ